MATKSLPRTKRMTRKEFFVESDRLLGEAQGFLAQARRHSQAAKRLGDENETLLRELEKRVLCGKRLLDG